MDRQNNHYQVDQQFNPDEMENILSEIRRMMNTFPASYSRPGEWEYTYRPSSSVSYSPSWGYKASGKFTSQPEDDEGMSDDDLEESQKMLFDFLGVSE